MSLSIALCIAPPFWPKSPALSLIFLQSFLLSKGCSSAMFDLNNIFYNCADELLKKKWLKSIDPDLSENMFTFLERHYPEQIDRFALEMEKFDVVSFSCYQSNLKTTLRFVSLLKQKKPNLKIILGGPEITGLYLSGNQDFTNSDFANIDLLVIGEGEQALAEYLNDPESAARIIKFSELENLDRYDPASAYRLIDLNSYPRKQTVSLLFSRGCARKCAFCSERLLYKNIRTRSISSIIEEIAYHRNINKVQSFIFHDSMLNMDLSELERLCDAIIKNFGRINWEAQMGIRPDMPDGLFAKIKQSGCYNLFIGLESGAENTLRKMRKGFTKSMALRFFKQLKKADLYFGVSIIVGYPDETESDFQESLRFLIGNKALIPKIEQVNPFVYYSGTEADCKQDFYNNKQIADKTEYFIQQLKLHKFKMTAAFLNNLIVK